MAGPAIAWEPARRTGGLAEWSDSLLASVRFQRWAGRFFLTRPVARRRARALFDLCAGFVYSQVLLACVRLRLCDVLFEAPLRPEALAARLDLSLEATCRLLDAAVALRLARRRRGGRYGVGGLGAALVGNPAIGAMVRHHGLLYADLAEPEALLRGREATALGGYWPYARQGSAAGLDDAQIAGYTALMAASQPLVAEDVLDAHAMSRHRCLLDLGGGDGGFLIAAARRAPGLRLHLFDLPAVAARGRARLDAAGLGGRATVHGGDFRVDSLPQGADIVSLVRVIHDHDDAAAMAILRAARRALPVGGTLLLAEPMAGTRGAEPAGDAYFGFYLLAMGSGRPRRAEQLMDMLTQAGFCGARLLPTSQPLLVRVVVARAAPMGGAM